MHVLIAETWPNEFVISEGSEFAVRIHFLRAYWTSGKQVETFAETRLKSIRNY